MRAWLQGDWVRAVTVLAMAAATTAYVWIKVQISELARASEAAGTRAQALVVESSRLEASLDLASRPSLLRQRAEGELGMTYPDPGTTVDLLVRGSR